MKDWQEHEAIYKLYTEGGPRADSAHPAIGLVKRSIEAIKMSDIGGEGFDPETTIKLPTKTYMVRELLITTLNRLNILSDDELGDFLLSIRPGFASGQAGIQIPKILAQKDREISERLDEIKERLERETILYIRRKVKNDDKFYAKVAREVTNQINKESERANAKNIQNAISDSLDNMGLQSTTANELGEMSMGSYQDIRDIELAVLDSYMATQDLTLLSIQTDDAGIESNLYMYLDRIGIKQETIGRDEKGKYITYDFFVPVDSQLAKNVAGEKYEELSNDPEEYEEYMMGIDQIFKDALKYDNIIVSIFPPTEIKQAIKSLQSEIEKAGRISSRAQTRKTATATEPKEKKDDEEPEFGEELPPELDQIDGDEKIDYGRALGSTADRKKYPGDEDENDDENYNGNYIPPWDRDEQNEDWEREGRAHAASLRRPAGRLKPRDINKNGKFEEWEDARFRARQQGIDDAEKNKKKPTGENNEEIKMSPQQMNQWMNMQRARRMQNNLRQNERWGNY